MRFALMTCVDLVGVSCIRCVRVDFAMVSRMGSIRDRLGVMTCTRNIRMPSVAMTLVFLAMVTCVRSAIVIHVCFAVQFASMTMVVIMCRTHFDTPRRKQTDDAQT